MFLDLPADAGRDVARGCGDIGLRLGISWGSTGVAIRVQDYELAVFQCAGQLCASGVFAAARVPGRVMRIQVSD